MKDGENMGKTENTGSYDYLIRDLQKRYDELEHNLNPSNKPTTRKGRGKVKVNPNVISKKFISPRQCMAAVGAAFMFFFGTKGLGELLNSKSEKTVPSLPDESIVETNDDTIRVPDNVRQYFNEQPILKYIGDRVDFKFVPNGHTFAIEELYHALNNNGITFSYDEIESTLKTMEVPQLGGPNCWTISGDYIIIPVKQPKSQTELKIEICEKYIDYLSSNFSYISQLATNNTNIYNFLASIQSQLRQLEGNSENITREEYLKLVEALAKEIGNQAVRYDSREVSLDDWKGFAESINRVDVKEVPKTKYDGIIAKVAEETNYPERDIATVYKYVLDNPNVLCYYDEGRKLNMNELPIGASLEELVRSLNLQGVVIDAKTLKGFAEKGNSENGITYNAFVADEGLIQLKNLYEMYIEYILKSSRAATIAKEEIDHPSGNEVIRFIISKLKSEFSATQKKYNTGPGKACAMPDVYIQELINITRDILQLGDGGLVMPFDYFSELYARLSYLDKTQDKNGIDPSLFDAFRRYLSYEQTISSDDPTIS